MALSPEDVIKKSFTSTHLRRGYDETQVDDFLDEVVVELRRLNAERVTLENDLKDCRSGQGLDGSQSSAFVAPAETADSSDELEAHSEDLARVRRERDELVAELDGLTQRIETARGEAEETEADAERRVANARAQIEEAEAAAGESHDNARQRLDADLQSLQARVDEARAEAEEAEQQAQTRVAQAQQEAARAQEEAARAQEEAASAIAESEQAVAAAADETATSREKRMDGAEASGVTASAGEDPTAIISLAQRLHDQHVSEGESTKARLVSEADSYRDRVQAEADARTAELLDSGQRQHDELV
ncbi:MAG: DivIVA domain-containing protein, partial [Ornithinimicrobium sp.]